jgi:5-methylcytosine-specific restriction endonuclease McrA
MICLVCRKYTNRFGKFCSCECGDYAVKNAPELLSKDDLTMVGNCAICYKKIYTHNIRKYCSPDCQRTALRLRNKEYRETIPNRFRFAIFAKYKNKCIYCGENAECIDHVFPIAHGGRTIEDNLVPACNICNSVASGKAFTSFDEKREYILNKRDISPNANSLEAAQTGRGS